MARHVREIKIGAYRGISNLHLKNLNDINILTGDNNSGKTSVLELLSTMDNPHNIGSWAHILRKSKPGFKKRYFYDEFLNLFPVDEEDYYVGYEYINIHKKTTKVELKAEIEETQLLEKEMLQLEGLMETEHEKETDHVMDTRCMHLEIWVNGEKKKSYQLYDFQTRTSMFVNKEKSFVRTVYISPNAHATGSLFLDDILSSSEFYEVMLDILKDFDENILSINAVQTNKNSSVPEYVVLTRDHKKAMPLNAYGDGMKKAILLLSALVEAKDGILLLDEFETAIHTSAMDSVFSWILESAKKLNVQVFLTSHSKEAIEKVLKCKKELQPNINVYTLYRDNGQNLVRTMNCLEAIHAQDSLGLELR